MIEVDRRQDRSEGGMMDLGERLRTISASAACPLLLLGLLLISTAGCPPVATTAEAGIAPDSAPEDFAAAAEGGEVVECFHEALGGQGTWEKEEPYGEVWEPPVTADWRPYTEGHWADTDQGWGWVDDEPWGWAVFHYGRWAYTHKHRWVWVPGSRWAPAWVAWRSGGGYVGWAPLPPAIGFVDEHGLAGATGAIDATHFTFVTESALLSRDLRHAILPPSQGPDLTAKTADVTRYQVVHHRIFNLGVNPRHIAEVTGQPRQRLKVAGLAASTGAVHGAFYQPSALAERRVGGSHHEFGSASLGHLAQSAPRTVSSPVAGPNQPRRTAAPGSRRAGAGTVAGKRPWSVAARRRPSQQGFQGQAYSNSGRMVSSTPFATRAQRPTRFQGNGFQAGSVQPGSFQATPRQMAPRQTASLQPRPEASTSYRYQPQQVPRFQPAAPASQFQRGTAPARPQAARPSGGGSRPSGGHRGPPS